MQDLSHRQPATQEIMRWFSYELAEGPARNISQNCCALAYAMVVLPDGPELTAGLRKLLEAKDCFVRAAIGVLYDGD